MSDENAKFGGGSGGQGNDTKDEFRLIDGTFSVTGNQVELVARAPIPPAPPKPCIISLLACDMLQLKGRINLHALTDLNITSGPPPMPPMDEETANGKILVQCSELQEIKIMRGLVDGVDQVIDMTPQGITVDGGAQPVTVKSLQKITLSVAEGMSLIELTPESIKISFGMGLSSIELGPSGITIQGLPLVKIN